MDHEINLVNHIADNGTVIHGHKVCQTRAAKWLCIDNIYEKAQRPNFYDIGGTYVNNVPDYWFLFKTEQISGISLIHLFVCNRQEGAFNIAVSHSIEDMYLNKKSNSVYFTLSLKEYKFKKTREMSQNYIITYSFSCVDLDFVRDKTVYIAVSFEDTKLAHQNLINQVKLQHDFRDLLKDPLGSDFTIESADGGKFQVHKSILSVQSEVFKAMLKSDTAESQNSYVKLVDVTKEDLYCILESIYTGTVTDLNNCNCINLLMLADRYDLRGLKELVQYVLSQQLSFDNALELLTVADMYNSGVLKVAALKFIKKNKSVIHSSTFKEINNVELVRELCEYLVPK
ncbi:hypothetical protein ACJJTC_002914 [Scirpophaga incertulas]